jgi:parvulin-like peptidyl-prolyl isomerase
MVHAAHIVKHIRAPQDKEPARKAIDQAQKELDSGTSFEEIASANSDCPERAGDLGYFPRGQMVQAFEDKVFAMKKGEISDIFLTEFGYHIVKKYDHIDARPRPFDQIKEELTKKLSEEAKQKEIEKYLDELTTKAVIEEK